MSSKTISERLYRKRLIELAKMYLIVTTCKLCGSPNNEGYVCPFCGKDDSYEK